MARKVLRPEAASKTTRLIEPMPREDQFIKDNTQILDYSMQVMLVGIAEGERG